MLFGPRHTWHADPEAIRVLRIHTLQHSGMIIHLELRELQTVCRRNDHHPLLWLNDTFHQQLLQSCQRHAGVRATVQPGPVRLGSRIGQFFFTGLLHHSVKVN